MNIVITSTRQRQHERISTLKESAETITIDYSPWAEDNGDVSAAVASIEGGQASVSNENLTSNAKTLVLTTPESGISNIKIKATAGNNIHVLNILVKTKEIYAVNEDYGIAYWLI